MRVVETFPHQIEMHDDVTIVMADGIHLAARIWRPVGSDKAPVPAILEFLPYRRRDGTAGRDALTHPYFAGHGYACVRVDMRGSGDSEGVLKGEYLRQEQDDALTILAWLESQPWCTGRVGMIGISWGGFNGLQVAALRPRQLQAVVSICSTDDRYADDIHAMGGALLLDKVSWGSTMFSLNAAPPDPAIVGDRWRELWKLRVEESGFWIADWLSHLRRDNFYKQGSICEDWSAIACPVFAVGGWADGYSNAVFRLLANLKGPRKGLVGPWAHMYPHFAMPGPQIGFLQECLRWWDKWLKDIETGVMDEPMLRAWMEDPIRPAPYNPEKPGHWVAEADWPPARSELLELSLSAGKLGGAASNDSLTVASPMTTGLAAGKWCPYGNWADQALDQRQEMGGQLIFDTAPLTDNLDVLGFPQLVIDVASDRPQALLAATLCEVFPDGASTRVSYGVLNLAHRKSHETPAPLAPGHHYRVMLQLNAIGHRFGRGNRIRLALSNAYWSVVWPSPQSNRLTFHCRSSSLKLPIREPSDFDAKLPPLPEAQSSPPLPQTQLQPGINSWTENTDVMTGETVLTRRNDDGLRTIDGINLTLGLDTTYRYTIRPDDPLSARFDTHYIRRYQRDGWRIGIDSTITMTCSETAFHIDANLCAMEGDEIAFEKTWSLTFPRDNV